MASLYLLPSTWLSGTASPSSCTSSFVSCMWAAATFSSKYFTRLVPGIGKTSLPYTHSMFLLEHQLFCNKWMITCLWYPKLLCTGVICNRTTCHVLCIVCPSGCKGTRHHQYFDLMISEWWPEASLTHQQAIVCLQKVLTHMQFCNHASHSHYTMKGRAVAWRHHLQVTRASTLYHAVACHLVHIEILCELWKQYCWMQTYLMLNPCQSQLTGCHILLGRQLLYILHQLQILWEQPLY